MLNPPDGNVDLPGGSEFHQLLSHRYYNGLAILTPICPTHYEACNVQLNNNTTTLKPANPCPLLNQVFGELLQESRMVVEFVKHSTGGAAHPSAHEKLTHTPNIQTSHPG